MVKRIDTSIDNVYKSTPVGSISTAIGDTFYGINHRGTPGAVPHNRDYYGLTFFTRPQLNMSKENLRSIRQFIPLLTNEEASLPRAVRSYLDPRLSFEGVTCPLVDPECAFIPLMTNHCLTTSGWPDMELQSHMSKPGAYKEVFGFIDSVDDTKSAYTISATFRNMPGSPMILLAQTWLQYMSNVFQGKLVPYPDYIMHNKVDYNTRIWRLVLDPTKTYVQHIGCTGAAYPTSVPTGRVFDYQVTNPVNEGNHEISIQFQAYGACFDDPVLVAEFNQVVGIFKPAMREANRVSNMVKIEYGAMQLFNGLGYPRIHPDTYELEWYVLKDLYKDVIDTYNQHITSLNSAIRK